MKITSYQYAVAFTFAMLLIKFVNCTDNGTCTISSSGIDLAVIKPYLKFNTPRFNEEYVIKAFDSCNKTHLEPKSSGSGLSSNNLRISFLDLSDIIQRRMYDYHYYFEALVKNKYASPEVFNTSLDELMDVFSKRAIEFRIPGYLYVNTWEQVKQTYREWATQIFEGFTQHIAPNVRVNPVFDLHFAQAVMTSGLIEDTYANWPTRPGAAITYQGIGGYTMYWGYESDGQWRIRSWSITEPGPFWEKSPLWRLN